MKKLEFKKVFLVILFLALVSFIVLLYQKNNCYAYRIDIKLNNVLAKEIDSTIASYVKDKLSEIEEIKEIVAFSRENNCSIYCKLNLFVFNKALVASKVQRKLDSALNLVNKNAIVTFDDNFDKKFETFIVLSTTSPSYKLLKKYSDSLFDELLALNITDKLSVFADPEITSYINYTNAALLKYDINLEDILKLVSDNNILASSTVKTSEANSYNVYSNSSITSIDDIKDIAVYYKNKNFSTKLGNIFNIKEDIKKPADYLVNMDDRKAVVLGLSKRKFYPLVLFNYKLNKKAEELNKKTPCYVKFQLLKTDRLSKIEVYYKNRTSIYSVYDKYREILKETKDQNIKNVLFFIGSDSPRISFKDSFFEKDKSKLTILSNRSEAKKIKSILNSKGYDYIDNTYKKQEFYNNNLEELYSKVEQYEEESRSSINTMTNKTMQIDYMINNYDINDYDVEKKEIVNTLNSYYGGLDAGYYYENDIRIPIVIQNEDSKDRLYFYSKDYKTLIYLGSTAATSVNKNYGLIVRKNDKYLARVFVK